MQRIKILGQGIAAGQLHHPFLWVIEPLANPEPIGGLQPRSPEDLAHLAGTTAAWVGEHRQSLWPLLQASAANASGHPRPCSESHCAFCHGRPKREKASCIEQGQADH